jgi:hypothetical protein
MAGDHGAVLGVVNKAVWDSKIQEAKHAGKVVSAFSFFLSFFLSLKFACPSLPLQLAITSFHNCSW